MKLDDSKIAQHNQRSGEIHSTKFEFIKTQINNCEFIISKLIEFQIAIPSWALGNGGTRFGRFAGGGEPRNLEEKIEEMGWNIYCPPDCIIIPEGDQYGNVK